MKRTINRTINRVIPAIVLILILGIGSPQAVEPEMQQLGPNYFVAGVPSDQFEYFAAPRSGGRQRQSNWCWAACIQMVLNYHGLYVAQEQIVQRIYGGQINRPAQAQQILSALSGWAPDVRGRYSAVSASTYILKGSQIVRDLAYRWPLIIGLSRPGQVGHAYVLTAVYYQVDASNEPVFHKVVLRDPWPGNPSKQELLWNDFRQRLLFIARVYVTRY